MDYCNTGNFTMQPFKSLYIEMKLINDRIEKCDLLGNNTVDMLQLCRYYRVKPLKNKLKQLISNNEQFRDFVHVKERKRLADGWLWYMWEKMGMADELFSWFWACEEGVVGKSGFFGDCAVLGNFDIYIEFVKSFNGNVMKLRQFSLANDSIFGIFLRRDLAVDYVHHEKVFFYSAVTLAYVIQPQLLLKYKKTLTDDCMFVLNDENKWELNVLDNPRYHPNERIKFLQILTNSTSFAQGLQHILNQRERFDAELVRIVDRLYTSFENFQIDWMLDKYDDLKDNIDAQKEIHEWFKYYIQYLFGISICFIDTTTTIPATAHQARHKTIIESNTNGICNETGLNIGTPIENGFKFIDLNDDTIKNNRDLQFFIETLRKTSNDWNDEELLYILEYPPHCEMLQNYRAGNSVPKLHFERVLDIHTFLQRRWDFR